MEVYKGFSDVDQGGVMFGIGMPELLVVLVIVLVIFGAGKLPEIGAGLGKGIKNFKKGTKDVDEIGSLGSLDDTNNEKKKGE